MRKDYYKYLPLYLQRVLDEIIMRNYAEPWISDFVSQYRKHVLENGAANKRIQTPKLFLSEFLKARKNEK